MVGVAVNVTEVPAQTGLFVAEIDTLTGSSGFTVIVTVFEVAGLPVGQIALEVSTTLTASLFAGTYAQVALVAPGTFNALTFH